MDFFDRKDEIRKLHEIRDRSEKTAQLTVLTGRRRIGKTSLVKKAYEEHPFIYLFVARKTESELCETFKESISEILDIPMIGRISRFSDIFRFPIVTTRSS